MSKTTNKSSPEVRARAVRTILDHEGDYPSLWSAVVSVADTRSAAHRRPFTIVDWRVSRTAHASFVLDALDQALHD